MGNIQEDKAILLKFGKVRHKLRKLGKKKSFNNMTRKKRRKVVDSLTGKLDLNYEKARRAAKKPIGVNIKQLAAERKRYGRYNINEESTMDNTELIKAFLSGLQESNVTLQEWIRLRPFLSKKSHLKAKAAHHAKKAVKSKRKAAETRQRIIKKYGPQTSTEKVAQAGETAREATKEYGNKTWDFVKKHKYPVGAGVVGVGTVGYAVGKRGRK